MSKYSGNLNVAGEVEEKPSFELRVLDFIDEIRSIVEDVIQYRDRKFFVLGRILYRLHEEYPEIKITRLCRKVWELLEDLKDEVKWTTLRQYFYTYKYYVEYLKWKYREVTGEEPGEKCNLLDSENVGGDLTKWIKGGEMSSGITDSMPSFHDLTRVKEIPRNVRYSVLQRLSNYKVPFSEADKYIDRFASGEISLKELREQVKIKHAWVPRIVCSRCGEQLYYSEKGDTWFYIPVCENCLEELAEMGVFLRRGENNV